MRYLSIRALRPSRWSVWFLLAVLTSTGCLYVGWDDVPNATVRPELHATYVANQTFDNRAYWSAEVTTAVAIWNRHAVDAGCEAPFAISVDAIDAHPIRLVPRADWPYARDIVGMYVDEYVDDVGTILIRERRPVDASHLPVLLHELGHAIGLTHDDDPTAVMHETTGTLTKLQPHDIARMRDALGC